jgi:hypothetical protein
VQISSVRNAIANAASAVVLPDGIGKLTCSGYTPDSVVAPHFFVAEYTQEYDKAMGRALDELEFTCRVLVSTSDDRAAQRILDSMLSGSGPASLKEVIEVARGAPGEFALGGLAHDLQVVRVQGYRWYEHQGAEFVGAELIVKVIGDGRS